jgi:hypothetical protein
LRLSWSSLPAVLPAARTSKRGVPVERLTKYAAVYGTTIERILAEVEA